MKKKEWLIKTRKDNNLSQLELANITGVNLFTIQNIEQGKRKGSVETWKKIEDVFCSQEPTVSYECSNLIEELKEDVKEFGINEHVIIFYKKVDNDIIFTNYDFITPEEPFNPKKELMKNEHIFITTLGYALSVFEEQNKIIR